MTTNAASKAAQDRFVDHVLMLLGFGPEMTEQARPIVERWYQASYRNPYWVATHTLLVMHVRENF